MDRFGDDAPGEAGGGEAVTLETLGEIQVAADPATASSIFLTTATDVFSMGTYLGLAAWLVM